MPVQPIRYGQSLSKNMLRRYLLLSVFIIVGLAVVCTAEPIRRRNSKLLSDNSVNVDCAGDHAEAPECRTGLNGNKTEIVGGDDAGVQEEEKSWNFTDLFDVNDDDDDSSVDEARGKKKKKGLGRYIIVMAAAAKATLMYVMIHAVALLAGKALIVAKVALALAAAVALKKAFEHGDKTSVEIIKHPQHSYVQTHSSSVDYDHGFEGHQRRRRYARRFARR